METNNKTTDIYHPEVAYERRDLSHRAVFGFLLALLVAAVIIHISIWGLFKHLGKSQFAGHQTTNPIMTSNEQLREIGGDPALSFPAPRLQPNPVADLNKFRAREEQQMNSYGWIDPSAGKIHIPIERAIDIVASRWPQQEEEGKGESQSPPNVATESRGAGARHPQNGQPAGGSIHEH